MDQLPIHTRNVEQIEIESTILLNNERTTMVEQLAFYSIAKGEMLRRNEINKMSFASILHEFVHVMLCACVR